MSQKSYLSNTRKELISIGGIGDFGTGHDPIEVPADVAHQYDTPEAKAMGWVVAWKQDAVSTSVPVMTPVAPPVAVPKPAVAAPTPAVATKA